MTRLRVAHALASGERVHPDDATAHHLLRVLRLAVGAPVEVVDGDGRTWHASVEAAEPLQLLVGDEVVGASASPTADLGVWLPLLKGGRTDDLVRQLTELGATSLVVFTSERSVAQLDGRKVPARVARWQRIAEEATRQCGRSDVPGVRYAPRLPDDGPGAFFWEAGQTVARDALAAAVAAGDRPSLRVLVGPEGGLSTAEAEALAAAGWSEAWLGPRVLRAETAVVAAAVLALHALREGGY